MRNGYRFVPLMLLCLVGGCQKESQPFTQVEKKEAAQEVTTQPKPAVVQAYDGPFGLQEGLSAKQLEAMGITLHSENDGVYTTGKLLKEHSKFKEFTLVISEKEGLCKIIAISETIDTDSFGVELRKTFTALEDQLQDVYGKHKRFDYLMHGSLWKEPQYWMMGLLKQERSLSAYWGTDKGSTMKNNVDGINLKTIALTNDKGVILLTYEFDNIALCLKKRKDKEKAAL
ncbi:MAG: hypothetical protein V5B39_13775 [Accumulibacter sp.]|uniref:hypothetical protein n=1 Tax=Accumulibacter sp. TaxID=2053492 RepID=UPI002FC2F95E